jgi:hypothetical protein
MIRCATCHDTLAPRDPWLACPACETRIHASCRELSGKRCPTYGCQRHLEPSMPAHPVPARSSFRACLAPLGTLATSWLGVAVFVWGWVQTTGPDPLGGLLILCLGAALTLLLIPASFVAGDRLPRERRSYWTRFRLALPWLIASHGLLLTPVVMATTYSLTLGLVGAVIEPALATWLACHLLTPPLSGPQPAPRRRVRRAIRVEPLQPMAPSSSDTSRAVGKKSLHSATSSRMPALSAVR